MDYSQPLITGETQFEFSQILEAIQPWLVADPQYGDLYASMGRVLDDILGQNLLRLESLRNADVQDDILLRLLAEFLGFEWKGSSTLSTPIIQKICQTIPSYYARNGCGANVLHKPMNPDLLMQNATDLILLEDYAPILLSAVNNTDFYNPDTFLNVQTTARMVSFAIQSSVVVQQLWTKDYIHFYNLDEMQVLFGGNFTYYDTIYSTLNRQGVFYQGLWDASTNTPNLQNGTGSNGQIYSCSVAGVVDFGGGSIVFNIGDSVEYQNGIWFKANNGVWYLSPHIELQVVDANTSVKYTDLVSLFYYLAPVTMVISSIKQRFIGTTQLCYNLQTSAYKITYVGEYTGVVLQGVVKLNYAPFVSTFGSTYVGNTRI